MSLRMRILRQPKLPNCQDLKIVDCASNVNNQQDPEIQNISDSDELSKQKSSNSTRQKLANYKQQSISITGLYDILLALS